MAEMVESVVRDAPEDALAEELEGMEPLAAAPDEDGVVGWTMFDTPTARDDSVVALLPKERIGDVPNRGLVRIESRADGREYLGIVQEGPFAEPDGLRGDAPLVVTVQVRSGRLLLPQYHGRVHIEVMGERMGRVVAPPRFRPLPGSAVFLLDADETRELLGCEGDMRLGLASGHADLVVGIPSDRKSVLPRHTGVLGTTGSGKSTTVSRLVQQARGAGMAVVVLDVEGEYAEMDRPADSAEMVGLLSERGLEPEGVGGMTLYHLAGTETVNPGHSDRVEFSPAFSRLSPYMVCEILDLSDAQVTRYWQAYEVCKGLLRELGVFPSRVMGRVDEGDERRLERLDEFGEGYPGMTLQGLLDVVSAFLHVVDRRDGGARLYSSEFRGHGDVVMRRVKGVRADSAVSWRALRARLFRLMRLNVFDSRAAGVGRMDYGRMVRPGAVSVVDLSDMEGAEVRNLVIADVLRGVEEAQEGAFEVAARSGSGGGGGGGGGGGCGGGGRGRGRVCRGRWLLSRRRMSFCRRSGFAGCRICSGR